MASKIGKILVVDDNLGIRRALEILLPVHFAEVKTIPSPATLVSSLEQFRPDVVLLDMNFNTSINTGNEGLYWAGEIKKMVPDVEVVLFTAYADIALAVEGMKRGAFDFLVKPWENDKLVGVLTAARDKARKSMGRDARSGSGMTGNRSGIADANVIPGLTGNPMFWGASQPMAAIRKTLDKIAPTDATVLITGENGTGKDVLAKEIHAHSLRSEKPMVAVDAGAITETLFESELFGHVKGAFTDAHTDHMGKFEQADGGTLFLDEIGNIPLHLQATSRPTGARCSSMKSAISRCICRRNCCAPSRTGALSGWAARRPGPSTSASFVRRTWIWKRLCVRAVSARTCTIASTPSISRCPRFGTGRRTSFLWRNCS